MTGRFKKNLIAIGAPVAALLLFAAVSKSSSLNSVTNFVIGFATAHSVILGEGLTSDAGSAAPSTAGQPLVSNGASSDPSFQVVPNSGLQNSSITFNSSGCITASGSISLGGSLSLTNTCTGFVGVTNTTPGATPTWTLANGDTTWTLSANVTGVTVTVATGDKWTPHTIQICEGGTSYTFPTSAWPSNVHGGFAPGTTINKCSQQSFESYDGSNLYATGPGVISQ